MRTPDTTQNAMFSYRTLEERIPARHPLRKLRALVDGILGAMNETFAGLYSRVGRPGIPPERLLRASLLQVLFSIRSERQLVQHIEYNLLYRWFVGLSMDEAAGPQRPLPRTGIVCSTKPSCASSLARCLSWPNGRS